MTEDIGHYVVVGEHHVGADQDAGADSPGIDFDATHSPRYLSAPRIPHGYMLEFAVYDDDSFERVGVGRLWGVSATVLLLERT